MHRIKSQQFIKKEPGTAHEQSYHQRNRYERSQNRNSRNGFGTRKLNPRYESDQPQHLTDDENEQYPHGKNSEESYHNPKNGHYARKRYSRHHPLFRNKDV